MKVSTKPVILGILVAVLSVAIMGQGGKAEPKRISFATGKSSTALAGRLSNSQEMEYVFAATKGQTVTISNPSNKLFDFRVFNQEFNFETEFDSSAALEFKIPETGDYLFFVRKRQVKTPRTARFSLKLAIR